jgi:hypothetical protein
MSDYFVEESLDTSWTNEIDRIIHSKDHPLREPLDYITIEYLYVSKQNCLVDYVKERYEFHDSSDETLFRVLTNETILYLIQSKKQHLDIRYKCVNAFLNVVDMEFEEVVDYSCRSFFREISLLHPVGFPPSIFIFHSLNRLYFIFREMTLVKSILDSRTTESKKHLVKPTKKVRISPDAISYSERIRDPSERAFSYVIRNKTAKKRV